MVINPVTIHPETTLGEVRDIGYAVVMLASPRSDFINGINFHVDGGLSPSLS